MDMKLLENEVVVLWDLWNLHQWTFRLGSAKRRLGCCRFREKVIELSEWHARNDPAEIVLDTLKHEIAHALTGPGAEPHGIVWKAWARKVGCTPDGCEAFYTGETQLQTVPGKWHATCPGCKKEFNWYRKLKHTVGRYCVACGREKGQLVIRERT